MHRQKSGPGPKTQRTRDDEAYTLNDSPQPKSLAYLDGTELDYVREGLNEGFKFNNPNEKDRCGCGESFNV